MSRYLLVKISIDENNIPYIGPQKLYNGTFVFENKKDDSTVYVRDKNKELFKFNKYYISNIIEVLVGKTNCTELRKNIERLNSKSKFNRFIYKIINGIYHKLRSIKNYLNS